MLHLGGTKIAGVLLTMDGAMGVEALRLVAPRRAVPVHYDDYGLFRSPLADFTAALERRPVDTEVVYVARGATRTLALADLRHGQSA